MSTPLSAGGSGAGAEGHRRTQGDGQGGAEAVSGLAAGLRALFIRASASRAASRCSGLMLSHTSLIAPASTAASSVRPTIGSMSGDIERRDEIEQRADQRHPHMGRRLAVERAVIGGEQILGEREFAPRARRTCARNRGSPPLRHASNARLRSSYGGKPSVNGHARRSPDIVNFPASLSISAASLMSSSVTPPASWVESVTSTFL